MKPILFTLPVLLAACSVTPVKRDPASASNFEDLPTCARIKYAYTKERIPVSRLPKEYAYRAASEAKTVWEATQEAKRDGGLTCAAIQFRDLVEKPRGCESWNGPYLTPELITTYHSLRDDDFQAFLKCWEPVNAWAPL